MWHIVKRKLWTQRSELKMMMVMSAISLMMIFAFGGFSGSYEPTVLIGDLDQSDQSAQYIRLISEDKTHQYEVIAEGEGIQRVKDGKAIALIQLEKGFSEEAQGEFVPGLKLMGVKTDADILVLKAHLLNRYQAMKNWQKTSETVAKQAALKGENYQRVYRETYEKLEANARGKRAIDLMLDNTKGGAQKDANLMHSLIGFLIFFVAYSSVFGATDILTERKQNTWQRLLVSPSSKFGMLLGNLIVSWVLGLIQLALVLVLGRYLFHIDFGDNIGAMFLAGALFCLAMSGLGILLSAFAKSMQQIGALTSVVLTAFGMLGGCLWPLDYVNNATLIGLSKITPHTYAVKALTGISQGKGIGSAYPEMSILALMAMAFLVIGFVKLLSTEEQYQ